MSKCSNGFCEFDSHTTTKISKLVFIRLTYPSVSRTEWDQIGISSETSVKIYKLNTITNR